MTRYDWYAALGKPLLPGESPIPYQYSFKSGTQISTELEGKTLLASRKDLSLGQVSALQDVVGDLFFFSPRDKIAEKIEHSIDDALANQYARFAHLDVKP